MRGRAAARRTAKVQALRAEAERLWSWFLNVVEDFDVDPYELPRLRKALAAEAGAPWARAGGTRIAVPLSRVDERFVLKMGLREDVADEQDRFLDADAATRRWILPIVDYDYGDWSIFPRARRLPRRAAPARYWRYRGRWLRTPLVHPGILARLAREAPAFWEDLQDDLDAPGNWGWFRGHPVVLDYGNPIAAFGGGRGARSPTDAQAQARLRGGCYALAGAMARLWPHLQVWGVVQRNPSVDCYTSIDHAFVVDPSTSTAYDIRGTFDSPGAVQGGLFGNPWAMVQQLDAEDVKVLCVPDDDDLEQAAELAAWWGLPQPKV